mgnify:FL=1
MIEYEKLLDKMRFPADQSKGLQDFDPGYTDLFKGKSEGKSFLKHSVEKLAELQEVLFAYNRYSLLIIFQAMDAAGKDGTIKHVMSGVNPQGCMVKSFKKPSEEELDHTYMWRCYKALPERGQIGIFNRSYYEEVLITRVHPEVLHNQKLPDMPMDPENNNSFWKSRYNDINAFEKYLENNGMTVLKFFLNISKEEQKSRFLKRIENPAKHWKISLSDFQERQYWDDYMHAYEQMLLNTSTDNAPWYVIPADHKWFMRSAVSAIIISKLMSLNLHYPGISDEKKKEIENAEKWLLKESL